MKTIDALTGTGERPVQEPSQVRPGTSTFGGYLDIALVVALVGPPALIGLLTLMGVGFALAVCVVFAAVFVVTTAQDIMWMWQRRRARADQWDPE